MINFKEHFKLTGLYTFFAAFPAVLQIVVYPIIEGTDRLGAKDFGYLAVAEAILSFLVMFCLYGMAITIARFYFDYLEDKQGYKRLVSTIFTGIVLRSIMVLGAVFIFVAYLSSFINTDSLNNFETYGYYLPIIAFNRTIVAVALALYRNEKRIRNFVFVSLVSGIARSSMQIIGVLYFEMSFTGYLLGTAIGGSVASISVIAYTYFTCGFQYSLNIRKKIRSYSFPLFLTDLVFWGILFFDRFMLIGNTEALGIYDNALKFAMGVQIISQGLGASIQPELFRLFNLGHEKHQKDIKTLSNLFVAENIAILALFLIPMVMFVDIFYETSLVQAAGLLSLVFLRYILLAQYQVFLWPVLFMKRSGSLLFINLIVLFVVVVSNILLVPHFSYYGAIASVLLAGVVQVALAYILQRRVMVIEWNLTKIIYFPMLIIMLVVSVEFLRAYFGFSYYISSFSSVFICFLGLLFFYRNELGDVISKIKTISKKVRSS